MYDLACKGRELSVKLLCSCLLFLGYTGGLYAQDYSEKLKRFLPDTLSEAQKLETLIELAHQYHGVDISFSTYCVQAYDSIAEVAGTPYDQGRAKYLLAVAANQLKKNSEAIVHASQGLEIFQRMGKLNNVAILQNFLATLYEQDKDSVQARHHYRLAHENFTKLGNRNWVGIVANNLAVLAYNFGDRPEAYAYIHQAIGILDSLGDYPNLMTAYNNLGDFSEKDKKFPQAIVQYQKVLAFPDSLNTESYLMAWGNLAWAYLGTGELTKARRIIDSISASPHLANYPARMLSHTKLQSEYFGVSGDFEQAFSTYKHYISLRDSFEHEQEIIARKDAFAKYELAQKDYAIGLQKLQIQAKTRENQLLIVSLILLSLVIFLGWNRMQNRQKLAKQAADLYEQEIKRLEQEKQLESAQALLEGQVSERKRIAQDLHDSVGGLLSVIIATLERGQLPKAQSLTQAAYEETRRIAHAMRPAELDLLGLTEALNALADEWSHHDLQIMFEAAGDPDTLPDALAIQVYYMFKELLQNAQKHAEATHIWARLWLDEHTLTIEVEDDGKGFDNSPDRAISGMGLKGISERLNFLGGKLSIDTKPQQGSIFTAEIPLMNT